MSRSAKLFVSCTAVAGLMLAGCTPPGEVDSTVKTNTATNVSTAAASSASSSATATAGAVTLEDAYVRAMAADATMTALFGMLTNTSSESVTVESFTANVDAGSFELHEVVDGQMREKEGGYVLAAGESLLLQPGHEHMMLMDVVTPLVAGETVDIEITLTNGETIVVSDIPVRTVGAGDESYAASTTSMSHG